MPLLRHHSIIATLKKTHFEKEGCQGYRKVLPKLSHMSLRTKGHLSPAITKRLPSLGMENFYLHKSQLVLDAAHSAFLREAPNLDSQALQTASEIPRSGRCSLYLGEADQRLPNRPTQIRSFCCGCWTYTPRSRVQSLERRLLPGQSFVCNSGGLACSSTRIASSTCKARQLQTTAQFLPPSSLGFQLGLAVQQDQQFRVVHLEHHAWRAVRCFIAPLLPVRNPLLGL